jgi:hypothetical protein
VSSHFYISVATEPCGIQVETGRALSMALRDVQALVKVRCVSGCGWVKVVRKHR